MKLVSIFFILALTAVHAVPESDAVVAADAAATTSRQGLINPICSPPGGYCSTFGSQRCCSGLGCIRNRCKYFGPRPPTRTCLANGNRCRTSNSCCSRRCGGHNFITRGRCLAKNQCLNVGRKCTRSSDCCGTSRCKGKRLFRRGRCTSAAGCFAKGRKCRRSKNCCSGKCKGRKLFKRGRCT